MSRILSPRSTSLAARAIAADLRSRAISLLARYNIAFPLVLFVLLRVWLSVWAAIVNIILPAAPDYRTRYFGMPPLTGAIDGLLWAPWQRWDTVWYVKIAEQGYATNDLSRAFFPLYPILIKLAEPLFFGNGVAAGVVIAMLAALASFILLYWLAREWGETTARHTLLYLGVFPTSFYFFAAYTESLFLALTLGAFFCARKKRWHWMGILGGLAGLVRPQGMLLILPLGIAFWLAYRRRQVDWRQALNLATVALGGLAFWIYLAIKFQNPLAGITIQGMWRTSAMPWDSLGGALSMILNPAYDPARFFGIPDLASAIIFLGLLVGSALRMSPVWSTYMAIIVLPPLFGITTYNPYLPLASVSRYVLLAFPGFILLGKYLDNLRLRLLLIAVALFLQIFWLILFVGWFFVG